MPKKIVLTTALAFFLFLTESKAFSSNTSDFCSATESYASSHYGTTTVFCRTSQRDGYGFYRNYAPYNTLGTTKVFLQNPSTTSGFLTFYYPLAYNPAYGTYNWRFRVTVNGITREIREVITSSGTISGVRYDVVGAYIRAITDIKVNQNDIITIKQIDDYLSGYETSCHALWDTGTWCKWPGESPGWTATTFSAAASPGIYNFYNANKYDPVNGNLIMPFLLMNWADTDNLGCPWTGCPADDYYDFNDGMLLLALTPETSPPPANCNFGTPYPLLTNPTQSINGDVTMSASPFLVTQGNYIDLTIGNNNLNNIRIESITPDPSGAISCTQGTFAAPTDPAIIDQYCNNNIMSLYTTVPYDVSNWTQCWNWCRLNFFGVKAMCQYNADGLRNCWLKTVPSPGLSACTYVLSPWTPPPPYFGYDNNPPTHSIRCTASGPTGYYPWTVKYRLYNAAGTSYSSCSKTSVFQIQGTAGHFITKGGDMYLRTGINMPAFTANSLPLCLSNKTRCLSEYLYTTQSTSSCSGCSKNNFYSSQYFDQNEELLDFYKLKTSVLNRAATAGYTIIQNATTTDFVSNSTPRIIVMSNNLTIPSNTMCGTKSIYFVPGNLVINPPFYIPNNMYEGSACMFIVGGTVTINPGTQMGNNSYDLIHAFIIMTTTKNDSLIIPSDNFDLIRVMGGIVGRSTSISTVNRKSRLSSGNYIPSEEFIYEGGRYINLFGDVFVNESTLYDINELPYINTL